MGGEGQSERVEEGTMGGTNCAQQISNCATHFPMFLMDCHYRHCNVGVVRALYNTLKRHA